MRILMLILTAALSISSLAGGEKKLPLPSDQKPVPDGLLTPRHDFGAGAATVILKNPSLGLRPESYDLRSEPAIDAEGAAFKAIFNSEAMNKGRPMGTGTSSDTMPPDGLED